ncbi:Protein kinase domain-containing protein [Treponema sp. JC4]|uniref:protein kinase domain-containing protein n=1 Tax=Treponema sp. JC4 TaxID=1124982 RepID=UPI00025B0B3A|nr:protein kinase [Treponema sp. JC4]EID83941.1 Protein kinase domain-containing protein [Treponema sp. JC4]
MYQVLELIGEGANGVVIKALNKSLDRIEAIKIWLPNRNKKNKKVDFYQYLAEVRKIANLQNDNIVTVYNAWEQDGYYLAATEFVDGKKLKDWLETPFLADDIKRKKVCQQLLETVLYYQTKGIIHGDIHSGNILIDNRNQVHIIDFGTSYFNKNKNGRQSIDREINLLYEDVKLILGNSFKDEFLIIKFNDKRKILTDSLEPILFTKTLLQYQKIISLKEEAGIIIDTDVLDEYCSYISDGYYFNYIKIITDLSLWSSLINATTLSIRFIEGQIHNKIFLDDWPVPYHKYELFPGKRFYINELEAVSAYVYFELTKNHFTKDNYKKTKDYFFKQYIGVLDEDSFYNLWNTLKNFEKATLFDVIKAKSNELKNDSALISNFLEKIRGVLSTLLPIILNNNQLAFYQLLWIHITEVRLNKELHDKIMKEIAVDDFF